MADDGGTSWEAPGPGLWAHDPAHFPRPVTGFSANTGMPGASEGFAAGFARYGHATVAMERRVVNGWSLGQRVPIGPELVEERERAAANAIARKLWRVDGDRWYSAERQQIDARCRAVQAIDPASLDDPALARHLFEALDLMREAQVFHFSHVGMFFVVGEWLLAAEQWGLSDADRYGLLAGASPATAEAARQLAAIAEAVREAGIADLDSLDDVRAASPAAARALDDYLETYGWRTISGFDVDACALIEMPEVVVASIRTALRSPFTEHEIDVEPARSRVPESDRARFDALLAEARYVYGIRDDDVGPCMWSRGLIRRALLEAAGRLFERGGLLERDHIFDASADEIAGLLERSSTPAADELASRAALRRERATSPPPPFLGTAAPSDQPLPPSVARVARGMAAYMGGSAPVARTDVDVVGTGVGATAYVGKARTARRVEDAFSRLEPGDVLVTPITTPAFNSVLPIAGALVVEFGGLTSHSGIMARELGLPAVLDARGCMDRIPDGAKVEVDPVAGTVRIL